VAQFHPDKNPGADAASKFAQVGAAYAAMQVSA
jgi:DnaJ-class molecular chaperone